MGAGVSANPYYEEYLGYWSMKWHDAESEMRRWFENYAPSKFTRYPEATEWMTIEEETRTVRGRPAAADVYAARAQKI